ncbi:protein-glutamate methylesterase/protein-glutamine glutaminase [Metabacillus sp. RGM 3146]|uniref:protein-glutamate methylesterase/protein-glutamine glutaminase n=1 Tax=Metabacillus sp. RGM 3146 TaxID=3401092 RepID=UPI003B9D7209
MDKTSVLIVDDSAFMRKLISDFLSEHPLIEVAGTARNGEDALKKIEKLDPDVITLDVEMPVMDGLETLKRIMDLYPRPVIMLSSTTQKGAENTMLSLEMGAIDFIPKPSGSISLDLHMIKEEMKQKVLQAKSVKVRIFAPEIDKNKLPNIGIYSKIALNKKNNPILTGDHLKFPKIVCIGTSTGGPRALQKVLTSLPKEIEAPLFIVQHMPKGFTQSLALRLNHLSKITVKEAENGEEAQIGTAYIAPGGSHMKIGKNGRALKIELDQSPPISSHRPSVDVMFHSLSGLESYHKIAVIMTGMGSDGTEGLVELKKSGNTHAIAESQATSAVFGMPKSAISTSLVDSVEDIDKIAESIMYFIRS